MRILRSLALALFALAAPLMRGAAQTCQGTAAFQDGRARVGLDDQYNSNFNDVGAAFAYGVPRSFFGSVSVDEMHSSSGSSGDLLPSGGNGNVFGFGASLGYQIHLSDTPFQLCPLVMAHFASDLGTSVTAIGFGGSLGYRVGISDWFALVPAAGVNWISTNVSNGGGTVSGSQVLMTLGLVFNRTFTINPGIIVPSQSGTKSIYTIGVSVNWANAVPR
jgi:hypothetical protein